MIQTSYTTRRALKRLTRENYPEAVRHSITICSWATDPANIGSITRLSEAYLVKDLYALKSPRVTDVGTRKWQPLEVTMDIKQRAAALSLQGWTLVALEQTDESVSMYEAVLPANMCLLVGNEGSGLPRSILDIAHMAVEIPQYGLVGSLNVATAVAIALYEWGRQHAGS